MKPFDCVMNDYLFLVLFCWQTRVISNINTNVYHQFIIIYDTENEFDMLPEYFIPF